MAFIIVPHPPCFNETVSYGPLSTSHETDWAALDKPRQLLANAAIVDLPCIKLSSNLQLSP